MKREFEKVQNIFDALRLISELEKDIGGELKKIEGTDKIKYKELCSYVDTILKDEAGVEPVITILKHPEDPNQPVECEIKMKDAVQFYEALSLYIGKDGCFIKSKSIFSIDTILEIKFVLTKENVSFNLPAKIIWLNPKPAGGRPAGMGIKFIKLNSLQKEILEKFMKGEVSPEALAHVGE